MRVSVLIVCAASACLFGCKSTELRSSILYWQEGNYLRSIETGHQALVNEPDNAEAHFYLGLSYSGLDSVGPAYNHFTRSIELDPVWTEDARNNIDSNFAKHYNRGLENLHRGREEPLLLRAAEAEFLKSIEANPEDTRGYHQRFNTYARLVEADSTYSDRVLSSAEEVFERANPGEGVWRKTLITLGHSYGMLGRPQEVIDLFAGFLNERPTEFDAVEKIGYAHLNDRDWSSATAFLELAADARLAVSEQSFDLLYNIGVAYYQMRGEGPEAMLRSATFFAMAIAVQPEADVKLDWLTNEAERYHRTGNIKTAAALLEKYVELRTNDQAAWRTLWKIYKELGDEENMRRCQGHFSD